MLPHCASSYSCASMLEQSYLRCGDTTPFIQKHHRLHYPHCTVVRVVQEPPECKMLLWQYTISRTCSAKKSIVIRRTSRSTWNMAFSLYHMLFELLRMP
ncbi:unnamed protein product [Arctogadus glacialis]